MTRDRLLQILQDYVNNDAEAAEPEYIRNTLVDTCGCSKEEIEEIGFSWLFPDDYWGEEETTPTPHIPIDMDFDAAAKDIGALPCQKVLLVENESGDVYRITKQMDGDGIPNPREDDGNLGTMVCWHPRYILGDEPPKYDPDTWLAELLRKEQSGHPYYGKTVYDFLTNSTGYACLVQEDGQYHLKVRQSAEEDFTTVSSTAIPNDLCDIPDWFLYDCCEVLTPNQIMKILTEQLGYFFMPLYLYDHSGLMMSVKSFNDTWDSGAVGWIYTTKDRAKELWGSDYWDEERAIKEMTDEVELYNAYLSGEAYGIIIAPQDDPSAKESCWGILEPRDMVEYIVETIGKYKVVD